MLRQASIGQIRRGEITREDGYIAVVMCFYPRGVSTESRDVFLSELAPERALFVEWKEIEREHGHEVAFARTRYEDRFRLSAWGLHVLDDLSLRSQKDQVYLACQCRIGERCHREMLLLLAQALMSAPVDAIHNQYPAWERRLAHIPWPIPESTLATATRKFPPLNAG